MDTSGVAGSLRGACPVVVLHLPGAQRHVPLETGMEFGQARFLEITGINSWQPLLGASVPRKETLGLSSPCGVIVVPSLKGDPVLLVLRCHPASPGLAVQAFLVIKCA